MADDGVVEWAMIANGYTINQNGGAFRHGVARPLEDKARVAGVYLTMKEENPNVSVREVSWVSRCGRAFGKNALRRLRMVIWLIRG